jgi:dipeptidyl aminopeptidase/acylaminoacyl peptidase
MRKRPAHRALDGKERRLLVGGNTFAIYASGFLLYYLEGSLMAQAFDPQRGQLKGDSPHCVAEHVALGSYQAVFDASQDDSLTYMTNNATSEKQLKWFDRAGKDLGVTGEIQDYWDVRLSPDGKKLASNTGSPNSEIWVDELTRDVRMRLTIDPETDQGVPVWSPDGNRIAFAKSQGKFPGGIYQKYSNGAGADELLLADPDRSVWPTSWSRDGRFILYSREAAAPEDYAVWVADAAARWLVAGSRFG